MLNAEDAKPSETGPCPLRADSLIQNMIWNVTHRVTGEHKLGSHKESTEVV